MAVCELMLFTFVPKTSYYVPKSKKKIVSLRQQIVQDFQRRILMGLFREVLLSMKEKESNVDDREEHDEEQGDAESAFSFY